MTPNERAMWILSERNSRCEAGASLRSVLDLLVDANLQEADTEDTEEEHQRVSDANLTLFLIASELTNGNRDRHDHGN